MELLNFAPAQQNGQMHTAGGLVGRQAESAQLSRLLTEDTEHAVVIRGEAGKGKTTALQDRELNAVLNAGGTVFIAREHNIPDLELLLKEKQNELRGL